MLCQRQRAQSISPIKSIERELRDAPQNEGDHHLLGFHANARRPFPIEMNRAHFRIFEARPATEPRDQFRGARHIWKLAFIRHARILADSVCATLKSWVRRAVQRLPGFPSSPFQLEHPSSEAIWKRAVEVFGNEDLARRWLDRPLPILGQSTPQQFSSSGDAAKQREI